jgi:hypothetical protein
MRSLRLRVTRHGNKDMWLSELTVQWFNFQRLRSKASPIHPSFPFELCARFFHTFPPARGGEFLGFVFLNVYFGEPLMFEIQALEIQALDRPGQMKYSGVILKKE